MKQDVQFNSDNVLLAGNLYTPDKLNPSKKYPAVVVGGSLTSVKEQMAANYAERLAAKGFVALAFDYRNYGASEGQPRQYENPALKLADLQAAVSYLLSLPYVQAVGALGICTTGGNVAYLAANDSRVKAVATAAAWLPDEAALPALYTSKENVAALRRKGEEAKKHFDATGENQTIPAYSNTDKTASHFGPMEYYMDKTRGGGVKEWKNEFAVMSWEPWLDFAPIDFAASITTPYMMVHSDGCALPENAKKILQCPAR